MGTLLSIGYIFMEFQKIGEVCRVHARRTGVKVFVFLNHRDLKNLYFFWKFKETFLLHQRTNVKKKMQNDKLFIIIYIFFYGGNGFLT